MIACKQYCFAESSWGDWLIMAMLRGVWRTRRAQVESAAPYVALVRATAQFPHTPKQLPTRMRIATYNVHRWAGRRLPQVLRHLERIDFLLLPPPSLVTRSVVFAVVCCA
jgi:hypothetical protein